MSHTDSHDTYVFQLGRRYSWNCPCGAGAEKPFDRRMDADDAAIEHEDLAARSESARASLRADHCICGMVTQELEGHAPQHEDWCEVGDL